MLFWLDIGDCSRWSDFPARLFELIWTRHPRFVFGCSVCKVLSFQFALGSAWNSVTMICFRIYIWVETENFISLRSWNFPYRQSGVSKDDVAARSRRLFRWMVVTSRQNVSWSRCVHCSLTSVVRTQSHSLGFQGQGPVLLFGVQRKRVGSLRLLFTHYFIYKLLFILN